MAKRVVFRVKYVRKDKEWDVDGYRFKTKLEAIAKGRQLGNFLWNNGQTAQLMIYKKNGDFQTEHSYGLDPRKSKG
jgi:hypothetical protein